MEMGYYAQRLDDLEKRKIDITSKIYADRLTLKAIDKEIEKCDEAIQKLGEPTQKEFMALNKQINDLRNDLIEKDYEIKKLKRNLEKKAGTILRLSNSIDKVKKRRDNLSEENSKLKYELDYANKTIFNLEQKLITFNANDDVILSENFGKDNIFEEMMNLNKK